ncbi:MAG TPA: hypothetical protein VI564_09105, partial [Candidatus Nanoarchaeia archaeon]|nr:hypothetical protein [Candidatus Nanoarchaeia archaeon]
MKTKNSILSAVIMVFMVLNSSFSFAATSFASGAFDVSIDRVVMNGSTLASSKTNLVNDADQFSLSVDITAVRNLTGGHVEATLRGKQSGDSVSDSSETFDLEAGDSVQSDLNLILVDKLKRETQFDLTVKVIDVRGRSETKTYGIRTESAGTGSRSGLDISIDRIFVNDAVIAPSRTNFIDEANDFSVVVEFTALENLENAHVEAVLKDLNSETVVADASPLFNLNEDQSAFEPLSLSL